MGKISYKALGNYLKIKREKAGVSQNKLAFRLGYTSPQFVSNWERGLAAPPPKALRKLVSVLSISERELLKIIMREQEAFWFAQLFGKKKGLHVRQ